MQRAARSSFGSAALAALCGAEPPGQQRGHAHGASEAAAEPLPQAAAVAQPCAPLLELLDISHCGLGLGPLLEVASRLPSLACLTACGVPACSGSPAASAHAGLARTLTALELMGCDDLSSGDASALLRACTSLRRLALSGNRLAAERFHVLCPAVPTSLLHLEVGFGTGARFLACALEASPCLASLAVHLGTECSDWHAEHCIVRCRNLRRLRLAAAHVSDAGLGRVLGECTQLTSLDVLHCLGPVTDAWALGIQERVPAFRLQHLSLAWCAPRLTDCGVARLLRPGVCALRSLALVGLDRLTDMALKHIAQHGATLECLALESCGTLERRRKLGQSAAANSLGPPVSATAVATLLARCGRLVALTISRTSADDATV